MYRISKDIVIAAAHRLPLTYKSKCRNFHGHNWKIRVHFRAEWLNKDNMVVDFAHIKKYLTNILDHKCLNDIPGLKHTTAEHMCKWICDRLNARWKNADTGCKCYRVEVEEAPGSWAEYHEI